MSDLNELIEHRHHPSTTESTHLPQDKQDRGSPADDVLFDKQYYRHPVENVYLICVPLMMSTGAYNFNFLVDTEWTNGRIKWD